MENAGFSNPDISRATLVGHFSVGQLFAVIFPSPVLIGFNI
jgi:hypothetical protein